MFLLIQQVQPHITVQLATLNSIMFLLIRRCPAKGNDAAASFKFHYVSINSDLQDQMERNQTHFKFHYVSINSSSKSGAKMIFLTLNSIMFLLIPFCCSLSHLLQYPLNSIMFLLIPNDWSIY